jgi:hypothetical protein
MTLEELVQRLVDALESVGIPYVLVGSLAASFYGVSRSTQDADLVVSCDGSQIRKLVAALGDEFEREPQMAFETVTATRKTVLRVKKTGFQIEVFFLSDDEHDQQRFERRRLVATLGRKAYVLSPEDVIVTKLRWLLLAGRSKDEGDLRAVLRLQSDRVDWPYIEQWCNRHGTTQLLDRLRSECARD